MQIMEEIKGRIEDRLLEDHKISKEVRSLTRITHLTNVIHVISWDTFPNIVHLIKTSSIRRTKSSMPMQLKRMNHMKRRLERMKTLMKNMS